MVNLQLPSSPLSDLYQQAAAYLEQGDYDQAATLYEQLTEADPASRTAYWYLGLTRLLQGQESDAQMIWLMAIAEVTPEQSEAWTQELVQVLVTATERQETRADYPTAWLIRQHIREIAPENLTNLLHLVQLALQLGEFKEEDLVTLGIIHQLQSDPPLELDTNLLLHIVDLLFEQVPSSMQVADLIATCPPHLHPIAPFIDRVLAHATRLYQVFRNKGLAYRYARLCLEWDGDRPDVIHQLACIAQDERRYAEGIELARRYYATCTTTLQKIMGTALLLRGVMNTGIHWQESLELLQQQTNLLHTLLEESEEGNQRLDTSLICTPLFFYPYLGDTPRETRTLQNQIASLCQSSVNAYLAKQVEEYQPYPIAPLVRPTERKILRIGYLSRFFYRHSVGWLCRWVLEHFDRDRFEVFTYFVQLPELSDFSKRWFANNVTRGCYFSANSDSLSIAKTIRDDEIDILVDLDSITSYPTCDVLALKPAPIQVTWLGMDASGLPAIDYFLADPYVLPDNAQAYYNERIWRLPQTYIGVDGFEVGTPTLRRAELGIPDDAVIYLSAQFAYKRHPNTIQLQLQILKQVSNSYFLIKGLGDEETLKVLFEQAAAAAGVESDRLRFLPRDLNEDTHRANLAIADIVLDTFPYNGATTTLETLWMGIPLVTRVGQQFAARNSYTMMVNAGLTEGIAWTDEDYVEWGVRLGTDAALRQEVASKLWRSRHTSPLWNGKQFTREMEKAYERMWEIYLQTL